MYSNFRCLQKSWVLLGDVDENSSVIPSKIVKNSVIPSKTSTIRTFFNKIAGQHLLVTRAKFKDNLFLRESRD